MIIPRDADKREGEQIKKYQFIIKSYKASHFSASLELVKEGVIDIRQHANFAPIYIKKTSNKK